MSTMNKTSATNTMSSSSTAETSANTTITPSTIQNPLKEEAARLFHCATSSSLALRSPSLTRMRECRYPLRFSKYNNVALTNHLTLALLSTLAIASSLGGVAADQTFTGQWNGEWLANSNGYSDYDNDDDGSETRVYSMWKDDSEETMSPDRFIIYASSVILTTMMLMFCCCYPEVPILLFAKFCGCLSKGRVDSSRNNGDVEGEYVGGDHLDSDKKGGDTQKELV